MADTKNGWPEARAVGIAGQAINVDNQSRDAETAARVTLHAKAADYNRIVMSWPSCTVARVCGFRPWRFVQHSRQPRR